MLEARRPSHSVDVWRCIIRIETRLNVVRFLSDLMNRAFFAVFSVLLITVYHEAATEAEATASCCYDDDNGVFVGRCWWMLGVLIVTIITVVKIVAIAIVIN